MGQLWEIPQLVDGIWALREALTLFHLLAKLAVTHWDRVVFLSEVSLPCKS